MTVKQVKSEQFVPQIWTFIGSERVEKIPKAAQIRTSVVGGILVDGRWGPFFHLSENIWGSFAGQ